MSNTVVLVDDNPEDVKPLQEILVTEGYVVRTFGAADAALQSVVNEGADLVLLGSNIAGVAGREICQQFKSTDSLADVPILFVSAVSELEKKARGSLAGCVDFIIKPFHKEEVSARVRTHMALYHSRQEVRSLQASLQRKKDSLNLAQAIARLGHWEWEMDSDEVIWSDEAYRILGFEPRMFVPSHDSLFRVIHPDDVDIVRMQIGQIRNKGGFDVECRILLPDGELRFIHCFGKVVCLKGCGRPHIVAASSFSAGHNRLTFIGVIQDITERKELERRLEDEAHTDALTGCATRRHFFDLAQREVTRSHRQGGVLSLLMLDLDCFKHINDLHGHQVGDLTLQTLARVCKTTLRDGDVVGRLGGEEFAVLLPQLRGEHAAEVAERLRQAIAAVAVPLGCEQELHFTTSIGVATLEVDDVSVDVLLSRADRALYQAKEAGRNRVCLHTGH